MAYAEAFQALADPTRRAVFERLREGPLPVGRLADGLDVSRPAVSQHLKVLRGAGLVQEQRDGTRRIYRVDLQGIADLREYLDSFWDDVLRSFKKHVESPRTPKAGGRHEPATRRRPGAAARNTKVRSRRMPRR
jgi:DNA-binding transcriptional ArsR family regulator